MSCKQNADLLFLSQAAELIGSSAALGGLRKLQVLKEALCAKQALEAPFASKK